MKSCTKDSKLWRAGAEITARIDRWRLVRGACEKGCFNAIIVDYYQSPEWILFIRAPEQQQILMDYKLAARELIAKRSKAANICSRNPAGKQIDSTVGRPIHSTAL